MELVNNQFTKPYPQEALGGELGLSAREIADSLGVEGKHIRQKLKRINLKNDVIFETSQMRRLNEINGLPFDEWYLNVAASKYIVATWKNEIGLGYFKYLLSCEQAVEKQLPLLIKQLEALQQWQVKKTKKRSFMVRTKAFIQRGLFGEEVEVVRETKPYENLTPSEKDVWSYEHRAKMAEGCIKKNNAELKQGKILAVASPKLLT